MPPSQFYVRLQHGMTGGFAPAMPSEAHVLTRSLDAPQYIVVSSSVKQEGQPSLTAVGDKKISVDSHASLIDELHSILKSIPTEKPPGSEDIYGLDISIAWGSDDLEWQNGGPTGCDHGTSEVKASAEDKRKFGRAVEIINQLVKEVA